ncbi:MAG: DUF3077 domain-containing protein [Pseudomonadota bacterium]
MIPAQSLAHPATLAAPFFSCSDTRQHLLAVRPGVPLINALESTYGLLATAYELAQELAIQSNQGNAHFCHATAFLIETAKATINACLEGMQGDAVQAVSHV